MEADSYNKQNQAQEGRINGDLTVKAAISKLRTCNLKIAEAKGTSSKLDLISSASSCLLTEMFIVIEEFRICCIYGFGTVASHNQKENIRQDPGKFLDPNGQRNNCFPPISNR